MIFGDGAQNVAQIFNLLYRRIAFCVTSDESLVPALSFAWPSATRRYGRLKICATPEDHAQEMPGA